MEIQNRQLQHFCLDSNLSPHWFYKTGCRKPVPPAVGNKDLLNAGYLPNLLTKNFSFIVMNPLVVKKVSEL